MSVRIVSRNCLFKYRKKSSSYTNVGEFLGYMHCCWLLIDDCPTGGLVTSSEWAETK